MLVERVFGGAIVIVCDGAGNSGKGGQAADRAIGELARMAKEGFVDWRRALLAVDQLLLKEVPDPQRFGVVRYEGEGAKKKIVEIIEKPKDPPSKHAVIGIYFYDADVFKVCKDLKPSNRGELEITDVNNYYLKRGDLTQEVIDGWWTDAGTIESLFRASKLVSEGGANIVDGKPTPPGPLPGAEKQSART